MEGEQLATITTIVAEIAMALHPILIKQIGVNLPTQLLARLGTYSLLGTAFSEKVDRSLSWGSWPTAFQSILFGFMNLIHIGSSYLSYSHLPAGSALALFYVFPFFNILAGVLFLGDTFNMKLLPLLLMAFMGVLLISKYTKDGEGKAHTDPEKNKNVTIGVVASIVAALTETLIFMVAKTGKEPSAWLPILRLYPGALLGLFGYLGVTGTSLNFDLVNWIPLILFNVFVGFLGYSLRFFSIPRLPTAIFSILTFIGVAAGYGWGLLYAKEVPSIGALAGAGLITGSLGILRTIS
jgi:drug/metabolite transporter (DMT)-like permease